MFESDHLITLTCHSLNKSQTIKSVRLRRRARRSLAARSPLSHGDPMAHAMGPRRARPRADPPRPPRPDVLCFIFLRVTRRFSGGAVPHWRALSLYSVGTAVRERTWHPHGHLDGGWSPPAQHPTVVLRLYSRGWFFPHGQTQSSSFCVAAPWPWASCAESVA